MEPVPPDPFRFVAARDRQYPSHTRQVMVKGRIEARYLGHVGKSAVECLGQQDLFRQMVGIEWTEPVQLFDHLPRNSLWLTIIRATMHDTMSYRGQYIASVVFRNPIHQ